MKIVKLNEEYLKSVPSINKSFLKEAIDDFAEKVIEAEEKLIDDVAKEMNISRESAYYYIYRYMNRNVNLEDLETGKPKVTYTLEMKSVEEIINYIPNEYDLMMEEKLDKEIFSHYRGEWIE